MKKILFALILFFMFLSWSVTSDAESTAPPAEMTVYITVTDITDVNNPFNILVDRECVTFEWFSLLELPQTIIAEGSLTDSLATENVYTYLHAIIALHQAHFNAVPTKFYLDDDGDTTRFWGHIVASIMYQNGDDIYDKPQNVEIHNGDELNICLYNIGHTQAIATFNQSRTVAQRREPLQMQLLQHFESPEENQPIPNAYITNEKGEYIVNSDGEPVQTDENGYFYITFTELGEQRISVLPEINYYLDTEGSKTTIKIVEYRGLPENELIKVTEVFESNMAGQSISELQAVLLDFWATDYESHSTDNIILFSWDYYIDDMTNYVCNEYPIILMQEPEPMISYTPPFATVIVETQFVLDVNFATEIIDANTNLNEITMTAENADVLDSDAVGVVAKYDATNGCFLGLLKNNQDDIVTFNIDHTNSYEQSVRYTFQQDGTESKTIYKMLFWDSFDGARPLTRAFTGQFTNGY